jgi:anaerobic magnesium-protoporphyrin IX monomethyl ester cyclase
MALKSSRNCKILLLNPRISGEVRYASYKEVGSYLPPYGLLSIAASLEQHGHIVRVIDADSRRGLNFEEIRLEIEHFKPEIIGMTCYSIGRQSLIETSKYIRDICPAIQIVGGPHVTVLPEDLCHFETIDVCVYGEGEHTMLDIVNHYLNQKELTDIKGTVYRQNGKIRKAPPRDLMADLDILPYPAFHLLDNLHDYRPMQLIYKRRPVLTLISGRGCPHNCIFCGKIWGNKVRLNSANYILGLIKKMIRDFGIREVMFYEDNFAIDAARLTELCDLLIQEKLNITWTCSCNIRSLNKKLLQKMKQAGCWLLSVGIESGNDEVLKFIRKPVRVEEARQVAAWVNEAGILLRGFFMINHLIDTKETIRQTINFAKELPLFTVSFTILFLIPGSKVREIAHKYGTVSYDYCLNTGHPGETLSFVAKGLTVEYLKSTQRRAYAEFFIRPIQIWRLIRAIDSWEDIKKYRELAQAFFKLFIKFPVKSRT